MDPVKNRQHGAEAIWLTSHLTFQNHLNCYTRGAFITFYVFVLLAITEVYSHKKMIKASAFLFWLAVIRNSLDQVTNTESDHLQLPQQELRLLLSSWASNDLVQCWNRAVNVHFNLYQVCLCKLAKSTNTLLYRLLTGSLAQVHTPPCRTHMPLYDTFLLRDLTLIFQLDSSSRKTISDLLAAQKREEQCRELKSEQLSLFLFSSYSETAPGFIFHPVLFAFLSSLI